MTNNHEQFVDFAGAGYFPDPDYWNGCLPPQRLGNAW